MTADEKARGRAGAARGLQHQAEQQLVDGTEAGRLSRIEVIAFEQAPHEDPSSPWWDVLLIAKGTGR